MPVITRLRERTDGPASPKKEKPSLAQFKQTHEPFARKQARRRAAAHAPALAHARTHTHARARTRNRSCARAPTDALRTHLQKLGLNPLTHAIILSAQALPDITDGIVDGATGATCATGGPKPAGAGRGDFINISNISRPKKARAPSTGAEMREMVEIDELLQEYGLE